MRVLMVTPSPPTPLKPRLLRFALLLAGHAEVHLAYVEDTVATRVPVGMRDPAFDELNAAGVRLYRLRWPVTAPFSTVWNILGRGLSLRESLYHQRFFRSQLRVIQNSVQPDVIHVDRTRAACMVSASGIPVVVDFTDPVGWYLSQRASCARGLARLLLQEEARRKWQAEANVANRSQAICFASEFGATVFQRRHPRARIHTIPNPLPPTVTTAGSVPLSGGRPYVGFWGNLCYSPNVEAIESFCNQVWPEVRKKLPSATLHIAGYRPRTRISRLSNGPGICIHPSPTNIVDFIVACDIAVSPLTLCAGFPNKVVEAIVQGRLPTVCSTAAVAGLPSPIPQMIATASSPEDWAHALAQICGERDIALQTVERLRGHLMRLLNPDNILQRLLDAYRDSKIAGSSRVLGKEAAS